jgi:dihydroorotase
LYASEGKLTIEKVVRMGCERPVSLFGIADKGHLEVGYDADISVVDLDDVLIVTKPWLESKCGWSPYEGMALRGRPVHTVVAGNLTLRDGELQGDPMGQPAQFSWK